MEAKQKYNKAVCELHNCRANYIYTYIWAINSDSLAPQVRLGLFPAL